GCGTCTTATAVTSTAGASPSDRGNIAVTRTPASAGVLRLANGVADASVITRDAPHPVVRTPAAGDGPPRRGPRRCAGAAPDRSVRPGVRGRLARHLPALHPSPCARSGDPLRQHRQGV